MKKLFENYDLYTCILFSILFLVVMVLIAEIAVLYVKPMFQGSIDTQYADVKYPNIELAQNPDSHEIYPGVYVEDKLDQETEQEYVEYLEDVMSNLPLYNYDYRIILTDEELLVNTPYAQGLPIAGYTIASERTIYIRYHALEYTLQHEIGHAVDRSADYSQSEEFQALYNMVEHDTYYTCNAREYFAYNYDLFVNDRLNNPELYEYFSLLCYGYCFIIGG